jgi:glycosyltransferase involved in cell wall biosynthesis
MTKGLDGLRVLNVFGQMERGGAELRAVELAEAFPPDHVRSDFLVLSGLDGVLDDRVRAAGGDVVKCALNPSFMWKFYRLLRQGRYDVVHSHVHYFSGVILSLAHLAGIRGRVSHLHTARVNDREDTHRRRIQLAVCRELIRWNATDIIAAGEGAMLAAWGRDWRVDSRCHVIYNSIRADRLSLAVDARSEQPTIVNVGSVKPLKNQLRLIQILRRVAAQCPTVQLRLIGKEIGDYGQEVRRAASAAGVADRLALVGEVDDAMPWLASADLMILPSAWEGLPCAVLEACAVGTPVLASDLPGTREIARHLPLVHLMPLDADDDAWAAAAVRIIKAGKLDRSKAAECLARSPFVFDRSSRAHYEIWSRLRATA